MPPSKKLVGILLFCQRKHLRNKNTALPKRLVERKIVQNTPSSHKSLEQDGETQLGEMFRRRQHSTGVEFARQGAAVGD